MKSVRVTLAMFQPARFPVLNAAKENCAHMYDQGYDTIWYHQNNRYRLTHHEIHSSNSGHIPGLQASSVEFRTLKLSKFRVEEC